MTENVQIAQPQRIGIGYDIHRLIPDRKLILAGVEIPCELGLSGHSDADVVLHAVTDALLGAAGLGDIGEMFPDTNPDYKDADSAKLLIHALAQINTAGFTPVNLDTIIIAEKPKLTTYKPQMRRRLAQLLKLDENEINLKAKTNEGLGPIGAGQAIAANAVVLITKTNYVR
ncbi:MAG: 2-C-methyl-D-erythritol 2,4-cyclodiphosphate synthase [Planctomycetes bacterium]|nr:2-C-methyl-D-erythritol 2,4-cyclodiphosphate synthase [Planctomycetota bacterium]